MKNVPLAGHLFIARVLAAFIIAVPIHLAKLARFY
jgi:hypothetical protein